MNIIIL